MKRGIEVQGMTFSGIADVSALYKRRRQRNPGHVLAFLRRWAFRRGVGRQYRCSANEPSVCLGEPESLRHSGYGAAPLSPVTRKSIFISAAGRTRQGSQLNVPWFHSCLRLMVPLWLRFFWGAFRLPGARSQILGDEDGPAEAARR